MNDVAAQGTAQGTQKPPPASSSFLRQSGQGRWNRLLAWLPAWLVFMAYLPALSNGFVWDDTYFLTDMPFLRSPELWPKHIFAPLFVSENYFRPLPLLQYVIEGRLSNLNPFLFHLTNLLLHAANTFMVGVLARRLVQPGPGGAAEAVARQGASDRDNFRAAWISAGAVLLFGLHPALIESVCWVSDRFDLMMTAMLLLALCCDTGVRNDRLAAVMIGALFLLGLLSKESTVLFMAVLPVWHLAVQARARPVAAEWLTPRRMMIYAALFAALALYLLIRRASLGGLYHTDTQIIPGTLLQHGLLVGKTLGWYLLVALWPFGLVGPVHPGRTPIAVDDPLAWAGVLAVVLVLAGAVWLIRRVPRAGWLLLCAACALGPVSNLLPLTIADNVIQDRYLIIPVAMLSLAAAVGLAVWLERPRRAPLPAIRSLAVLAAAWCVAALVSIVLIVPHWASDLSLWSWGYGREPTSKIATGNYMTALANAGRNAEVIEIGKAMLDRYPDTGSVLHNIGLALMRQGHDAEAIDYVKRALRYLDDHGEKRGLDRAEALNLLGLLYMRGGELDSADKALQEAVKTAPFLTRPHFNLAMLAYQRRDIAGARREMAVAIQYDAPQMAAFHRRSAAEKEKELGLADSPFRADPQTAP